MDNFERNLEKFADVIIKVGLNLQAGQRLMIGSPYFGSDGVSLEAHLLVREITKVAYQSGAKYVGVNWDDEELHRIRVQHAALETMEEGAIWKTDGALDYINNEDAFMIIYTPNADLLAGLDADKLKMKQKIEAEQRHRLFSRMSAGVTNWLGVSASVSGWSQKVFPDLEPEDAKERLWDAIFKACRVYADDPVAEWQQHIKDLAKRSAYLNDKRYTELKYTAPGTDLTIGLPEAHLWNSGGVTTQSGIEFVANIPTEEVFTLPHKDRVNGVVTSTKPLNYGGSLIENFTLKFVDGKVVESTAESGQEALDNILNTDETSRYLGEVALVPHSSPISQAGLLFYNILFDENASNHLALGNAYRFSMQGGMEMDADEFVAAGGNQSITHADFMVGSGEMDIDGILADGTSEPVMRQGEWAFEV